MSGIGDPAGVKSHAERAAYLSALEKEDLRRVMRTAEGRRVLDRYMGFTGWLREAFNHNGSVTNYTLGRQSVGRKMYADIDQACPDLFMLMRVESEKKDAATKEA